MFSPAVPGGRRRPRAWLYDVAEGGGHQAGHGPSALKGHAAKRGFFRKEG